MLSTLGTPKEATFKRRRCNIRGRKTCLHSSLSVPKPQSRWDHNALTCYLSHRMTFSVEVETAVALCDWEVTNYSTELLPDVNYYKSKPTGNLSVGGSRNILSTQRIPLGTPLPGKITHLEQFSEVHCFRSDTAP